MILYSYEKIFQEDILHFIINHKWMEKKKSNPHFLLIYYHSEHTAIILTLSNYFCCYTEIRFMEQVLIQDLPTLDNVATCLCSSSLWWRNITHVSRPGLNRVLSWAFEDWEASAIKKKKKKNYPLEPNWQGRFIARYDYVWRFLYRKMPLVF